MQFRCSLPALMIAAAIIALPNLTYGQVGANGNPVLSNQFIDFEGPEFDANDPAFDGLALDNQGFDFFFSSSFGNAAFGDFSGFQAQAPFINPTAPNVVAIAGSALDTTDAPGLAGEQSLVFFPDFNSSLVFEAPGSPDPRQLNLSTFAQLDIAAGDIGQFVEFEFLFSDGDGQVITDPNSSAEAFLLTLDPNNGFATTNDIGFDLLTPPNPGGVNSGSIILPLSDPALVGQILQFGLRNSAQDQQNPAVIVDNLTLSITPDDPAGVPEPGSAAALALLGLGVFARRRRS